MPGPLRNGVTKANGRQQEQHVIKDDREITLYLVPRQKAQHADVANGAEGHNDAQVGLVEFGVLLKRHTEHPELSIWQAVMGPTGYQQARC